MKRVVIKGEFSNMNEFIRENRSGWNAGNSLKHREQNRVLIQLRQQLRTMKLTPPLFIHFRYYRSNRRVDPDNIETFFHKIFMDALVQGDYIRNDGWQTVLGFHDRFYIDSDPKVVVEIEEEVS